MLAKNEFEDPGDEADVDGVDLKSTIDAFGKIRLIPTSPKKGCPP